MIIFFYYCILFWILSIFIWFPFWTTITEVIIEQNYPDYADNEQVISFITLFVALTLSPLAWILFTKILYKYVIRKDRKQTIKMIIAEIYKKQNE